MNEKIKIICKENKEIISQNISEESHPWDEKTQLATFERIIGEKNPEPRYARQHLKVELRYSSLPIQKNMQKALLLHINNSNPYFQKYYMLQKLEVQHPLCYRLQAEPYRYTLQQILNVCIKLDKKLPNETIPFAVLSLLQIYKYILYLFEKNSILDCSNTVYDPSIDNLAFNLQYRLILINHGHHREIEWRSIRKQQNLIRTDFRKIIAKTLRKLQQLVEKFEDHGITKYFETDQRQILTIEQEKKVISVFYSSIKSTEIPEALFLFLKNIENKIDTPLNKFFLQKEESAKKEVQHIISNRVAQ